MSPKILDGVFSCSLKPLTPPGWEKGLKEERLETETAMADSTGRAGLGGDPGREGDTSKGHRPGDLGEGPAGGSSGQQPPPPSFGTRVRRGTPVPGRVPPG